ncbi:UvrD-helicase domain-containing protein [Saccharococcus caldoxylosilyticus]|uniref:UvrD-helicase domain-containing protein n=1 Tax=Saccharococcus caldoxylosilyticus TaxID=81408 RepID=UPI001FCAEB68|nr:UvrD-helicase domain-containing protein [Parageobacillus caldoxylosilyticus]BDG43956.1 hypothetical protein PcaKH35_23010 [Parageobacillus caldoxylosilyticus]
MLTDEQRRIVESKADKILVRAGAGTGKTEVLTQRIIHLLEENQQLSIRHFAIITFTNKATENLRSRLKKALYRQWSQETDSKQKERYRYELELLNLAQISTIHQFCRQILDEIGPFEVNGMKYAPGFRVSSSALYDAVDVVIEESIRNHQSKPLKLLEMIPIFKIKKLLVSIYKELKSKGVSFEEAIEKTNYSILVKEEVGTDPWKIKKELLELLQNLREEHIKRKLYELEPDDLLEYAYLALKTFPEVASRIRRMYQHIFVDEFQDTSLFQAEILKILCSGCENPPHLFVVGDAKQSIYQFRGADIQSYEYIEQWIEREGEVLTLSKNFRSLKPLVDYVNSTFLRIMTNDHLPNFRHEFLQAHDQSNLEIQDVVFKIPLNGQPQAERVASFIAENVKRGENAGNFAVLFRTNKYMLEYEEALKNYHIPVRVFGAGNFFQKKEIIDLYKVIIYLLFPNSYVYQQEALYTDFINGDLQKLLNLKTDMQRPLLRYSVVQIIEEIYQKTQIRELYRRKNYIQGLANLDYLKEITRELLNEEKIQLVEYVKWLEKKIETDREQKQAEIYSSENNEDAVTLITIHSAKGLEYPYVILVELDRNLDSPYLRPPVLYSPNSGIEFSIKNYTNNYYITSHQYDDAFKSYNNEYLAEEARILYVAMTRAEKRLYLLWNEELPKGNCYQKWL